MEQGGPDEQRPAAGAPTAGPGEEHPLSEPRFPLMPAPPRPRPVAPGPSVPGGWRSTAAVTVLCGLIVAGTGWVMAHGLARSPLPRPAEQAFAARTYAINRFGLGAAHLRWLGDGPAALQVAGYQTLRGALGRTGDAVPAARAAMIEAAVLTSGALGVAACRLRLSVPATGAVVALFGLAPAAVLLHRTADPTNLAVLWACLALAVAAGPAARATGRASTPIGSLCCAALAVLSSPLALVALVPVLTAQLWSGELGRLHGAWRHLAAAAGAVCWTGLVALVTARRLPPAGSLSATTPAPTAADLALLALGLVAGLAAMQILWLRSLAVGLIGTAVAAAVLPTARPALIILGIPLLALLLPAVADALVAPAIAWHLQVPAVRRLAPAGMAGVLLLGTAAMASPSASPSPAPPAAAAGPTTQARDWVLANLPDRPRLAVDDAVWFALIRAGYPVGQLASVGQLGPPGQPWPHGWADASFVVGTDDALLGGADRSDLVRQARMHSTLLARFGGMDQVTVRRVVAGPADPGQRSDPAVLAQVAAVLLGNPNLQLDPHSADVLHRGRVDNRLVLLLGAIVAQHRVVVAGFPVVPGEDPSAPRRLVVLTGLDGHPTRPGSGPVADLDQWMLGQRPPLRPASTTGTTVDGQPALLVRYAAS